MSKKILSACKKLHNKNYKYKIVDESYLVVMKELPSTKKIYPAEVIDPNCAPFTSNKLYVKKIIDLNNSRDVKSAWNWSMLSDTEFETGKIVQLSPDDFCFGTLQAAISQIEQMDIQNGEHTSYQMNGMLKSFGKYKKGAKNGFWLELNNLKISYGNYKNGYKNGFWFEHNEKGFSCGRYFNNGKHGLWKCYDYDKNLLEEGNYIFNNQVGVWLKYQSDKQTVNIIKSLH